MAGRNKKMIVSYLFISLCIQVSLSDVLDGPISYENYKIFEIEGKENEINKIMSYLQDNHELAYHSKNGNKCQILIAPQIVPIVENMVQAAKLTTKAVVEDYSEIIKNEKPSTLSDKSFSWTAYYDIDDIYDYLRNMSRAYSEYAHLIIGGKSYEGRDILGLRIMAPTQNMKPAIFIESGIHAREWITPATTTYLINQLLTSEDPHIVKLRKNYDWHIFPSVNPDGYHYSHTRDRLWRKTRSKSSARCYGTDPNRNWDYNWMSSGTSKNPCDEIYGGTKPFSEIETRSLSKYISEVNNLKCYLAFHSDVQMLLLPYSDSTEHNQYYDDLKKIGQTSIDYGYQVNKIKYKGPATAAEILYKSSGGSVDWVHQTLGIPLAVAYELRGKYFHWPPHRIYEQGDEVTQMILGFTTEAQNLGYF